MRRELQGSQHSTWHAAGAQEELPGVLVAVTTVTIECALCREVSLFPVPTGESLTVRTKFHPFLPWGGVGVEVSEPRTGKSSLPPSGWP